MKNSNKETNRERWRPAFFLTGLVLAMFVIISAFEWKTPADAGSGNAEIVLDSIVPQDVQVVYLPRKIEDVPEKTPKSGNPEPVPDNTRTDIEYKAPDFTAIDDSIQSLIELPDPDPVVIESFDLDRLPIFKGCEGESNEMARKACLNRSMAEEIINNLDIKSHEMQWLDNRLFYVELIIDSEGRVTKVDVERAPTAHIEMNVKEILGNLPQFMPGLKGGKYVASRLVIPVSIQAMD